jgi:hypothetical protein
MPSPKAGGKCHEEEASRLPVPVLRRQDHNAGRERIAISDPMRELIEEVAETRPQLRTLTLAQTEVFSQTAGQEKLVALLTATLMTVEGQEGVND